MATANAIEAAIEFMVRSTSSIRSQPGRSQYKLRWYAVSSVVVDVRVVVSLVVDVLVVNSVVADVMIVRVDVAVALVVVVVVVLAGGVLQLSRRT